MFKKTGLYFFLFLCLLACKDDTFTWNLESKPDVGDISITSNVLDSVFIQADLKSNGHTSSIVKGFCWSDSTNNQPTVNDELIIIDGGSEGTYSTAIAWDTSSQGKYVRAFAQNDLGISYSDFVYVSWPINEGNSPEVQTLLIQNIGFYSVEVSGQLISNGGIPWTTKGVLLSESPIPNADLNALISYDQGGDLNFTIAYNQLEENTTYYVRAFAENEAGISFGQILSFITSDFYEIGETGPGGGIICYNKLDSSDGWNFMEMFPLDIVEPIKWSNDLAFIGTSFSIGSGLQNTILICSTQLGNQEYAARVCKDFSTNGFSDWFLPSRDELLLVYNNLYLNGMGSLYSNGTYWSSSEDNTFSQNAWVVRMNSTDENICYSAFKQEINRVRPIRKF